MAYKYLIVLVLVFVLLDPTEAWRLRRVFRNIGRGIRKGVKAIGKGAKAIGKGLKKVGCKLLFGVACPVAVGAAGTAISAGTSGVGTVIVGAGVIAGKYACRVRSKKCRRSAGAALIPFSDDIRDYDTNGDKLVSYEEFVFAVMRSVELADPTELEQPFLLADFNDDGVLDTQEFDAAPFLYAHASVHIFQHNTRQVTVEPIDNSTTATEQNPTAPYVTTTPEQQSIPDFPAASSKDMTSEKDYLYDTNILSLPWSLDIEQDIAHFSDNTTSLTHNTTTLTDDTTTPTAA